MLKRVTIKLVIALAFVTLRIPYAVADETEIVVIGYGAAHVMPDRATIEVGISTVSRTAEQAADSNSALHGKVVSALEALGIDHEHMQTSYYSVTPIYPTEQGRPDRTQGPNSYSADHVIKVWTDELDELGALIDASLAAGATSTRLTLTSSKLEEANRLALEDAAKQAKADAEALAKAVDARLGSLVLLTTHIPREEPDFGGRVGASQISETSIMPRELRINARVMGKWKLEK